LQVANLGLILFATGPPDLGKIQLGYPEKRSCSTSDFEALTSVIDHEQEFVIRASSLLLLPSALCSSVSRRSFVAKADAVCPALLSSSQ